MTRVAAATSTDVDSATLAEEYYPDAEIRRPFEGTEALIDIEKARSVLGWEPERTWRTE